VVTVLFFHLTRSSVEQTARTLLARALKQGWRVMIRGTDPARLDHLDRQLWLGPEEDFIAHGRAGGPYDSLQPVLLSDSGDPVNDPSAVMLLDGAAVDIGQAQVLERVWVLFEGEDTERRDLARGQWRQVTGAGLAAQYWSEESGRWDMKMERAATVALT
jgi:DNA polymerase III subunit chi